MTKIGASIQGSHNLLGEARYEKMMSVMFLRSATKANCVRVPLDSVV